MLENLANANEPGGGTVNRALGRLVLRRSHPRREAPDPTAPPTPGQEEWLASLDADRRERFDGLEPAMRAFLLAPHQAGLNHDRVLDAEAARILGAAPPPDPDPENLEVKDA